MQENENDFYFDLFDLYGIEGVIDYCSKRKVVIYSVGSMIIYWELDPDKKLFVNYHESTIASLKVSHSGNYFISIDKNICPRLVVWELPSFNILYQNNLSVDFNCNKDEFPEESKFLREEFKNINTGFNSKKNNKDIIIQDVFIEFYQANYICVLINVQYSESLKSNKQNMYENTINNRVSNFLNHVYTKQIFYFFEISKEINLKFFKIIDNEKQCLGMKTFLNGKIITVENKLIKGWKIDFSQNKIKLKTKIHLKQNIIPNQLQLCEYLKMIIVLTENLSCWILDETGVFLLSINSDYKPDIEQDGFNGSYKEQSSISEHFFSIYVFNEVLCLTTNKGNISIYNLNGFKYMGKIDYDITLKRDYILNHSNKYIKSKTGLQGYLKNDKCEKSDEINKNNTFLTGIFIKNLYIDEDNNLIILKFSDNSLSVSSLANRISLDKFSLEVKYKNKINVENEINGKNYLYNLEKDSYTSKINSKYYVFSHFNTVTDICWLNNNFKCFITSSPDQSLMLWTYRGDKWVNHYFDLLKIFDKNLNNFANQNINTNEEIISSKQDDSKYLNKNNYYKVDNASNKLEENVKEMKIKYFINVMIFHPRNSTILVAGDNKGNIYQFDSELKENPKRYVVSNFSINSLSFSKSGNYISIGFSTGNVILCDFHNGYKFCCLIEDFKNQPNEIESRKINSQILTYSYIFKNTLLSEKSNKENDLVVQQIEKEKTSIKIFSMNSYQTLRIQIINKSLLSNNLNNLRNNLNKENNLDSNYNTPYNYLSSTIKNFEYNFKIKNIQMHVSEDYFIILFENNSMIINRIDPNIITGVISLNSSLLDFHNIEVDPSGLYLAVVSDSFANHEQIEYNKSLTSQYCYKINDREGINNFSENDLDKNKSLELNVQQRNFCLNKTKKRYCLLNNDLTLNNRKVNKNLNIVNDSNFAKDNIRKRSSVIIYELGTGNFVSILKNIFVISNVKFSNDGRFICIASDSGCISIWNIKGEIRDNIRNVLEEIKMNPHFWDNYRINFNLENSDKMKIFIKDHENEDGSTKNSWEIKENNVKISLSNKLENNKMKSNQKPLNYNTTKIYHDENSLHLQGRDNYFSSCKSPKYFNNPMINEFTGNDITPHRSIYLNYDNTNNLRMTNFSKGDEQKNPNQSILNFHELDSNSEYRRFPSNTLNKIKSSSGTIFASNKVKNSSCKLYKNKNNDVIFSDSNPCKKNILMKEGNIKLKNLDLNLAMSVLQNKDFYNIHKDKVSYHINNTKENFEKVIYPEPEDIDNLAEDDDIITQHIFQEIQKKNIGYNSDIDAVIEHTKETSKNKISTADHIDYIENKIQNIEKIIHQQEKSYSSSSSRKTTNSKMKGNLLRDKNSYLKESIDSPFISN